MSGILGENRDRQIVMLLARLARKACAELLRIQSFPRHRLSDPQACRGLQNYQLDGLILLKFSYGIRVPRIYLK